MSEQKGDQSEHGRRWWGRKKEDPNLSQFSDKERREIEQRRRLLSSLAHFIGKDFSMPVKFGKPGEGWSGDLKNNSLIVDPEDLATQSMDTLRYRVSSQAGRRRISRLEDIPQRQWEEPGYQYLNDVIETARANNFVAESYPKFAEHMNEASQENQLMDDHAERIAREQLGFVPRFMQAGRELARQWYGELSGQEVKISEDTAPEVVDALRRMQESASNAWWQYPSRVEADMGEKQIKKYAQSSRRTIDDRLWPEFHRLVEQDMQDAAVQEMLKKMQQEREQQEQESQNNEERQKQSQRNLLQQFRQTLTADQVKQLEEVLEKKSQQPIQSKEIQESQQQPQQGQSGQENQQPQDEQQGQQNQQGKEGAQQEQAGKENQQGRENQQRQQEQDGQQSQEGQQDQQEQESQEGAQQVQEGQQGQGGQQQGGQQGQEGQGQQGQDSQQGQESLSNQQGQNGQSQQASQAATASATDMTNRDQPGSAASAGSTEESVNMDLLPDSLKQKLQEFLDRLPWRESKEIEEQARERMKEVEEKLNAERESKLNETATKKRPVDHEAKAREEVQNAFRRQLYESVTIREDAYDKAVEEMLPIIDRLENDLREIFVQRRKNAWESGFRFGKRVDMGKRIQEKAKDIPVIESRAWQKKEAPQAKDYAITLLVDLSGSMRGENIAETFKGVVALAEVLNRLSIRTEILGFNSKLSEYQSFSETLNKDIRADMTQMLAEVHGDSSESTDTGWAMEISSERLARQRETEKFLIVLTDGQPSSYHNSRRYELADSIKQIKQNTDQKLIGLGLGSDTGFVANYFSNNITDIAATELGGKLAELIKDAIENYNNY